MCARYRPQFPMHSNQPRKALRSKGTLLPRPARYRRSPPIKCRGLGSSPSVWNLNRGSSIRTGPCPCVEGLCAPTAGDPPLESVYALGSSDANGSWETGREEAGDGRDGGSLGGAAGSEIGGGGGGAPGAADGGGGGGAEGEECPRAERAACAAIEGAIEGGGGGVDLEAAGGGGGARPTGADGGGGGGPDGFLDVGGGGSLPGAGGGGGARGGGASGALVAGAETVDDDREAGLGGGFFKPAIKGLIGGAGGTSVDDGRGGGLTPGGRGAVGGLGAGAAGGRCAPSESEIYGESRLAPVSIPPRLRSLGIPPANKPPN